MKISPDKLARVLEFGKTLERKNDLPDIEKIAGLFPRGFMSIVASAPGTGKTWLMQYLTCQLSTGGRILNGLVAKSKPYKSIILSGETGSYLLEKRLSLTNWSYDSRRIKVYSSVDMSLAGMNCMINTQEGQETLIAIVYQEKPDIIFLDTLISFHTCDESNQAEMTAIYTFLLRIAKSFNCAVVLNHHTRKKGRGPDKVLRYTQDDVIGSSASIRLASAVYAIEKVNDETNNDRGMPKMMVHNVKNWDKRVPDFTYQFIHPLDDEDLIDFKIGFDTDNVNIFWSMRERLKEYISSLERGTYINPEGAAQSINTTPENARNYLEEFTKKNLLDREKVAGKLMYRVL